MVKSTIRFKHFKRIVGTCKKADQIKAIYAKRIG